MVATTVQAMQQLVEEGIGHLLQSVCSAQTIHLQATTHVPSVLAAHTSMARSTLVAITEHIAGVATSSSAHLHCMAEQSLVVVASHIMAASTTQLWVALAAS